MCECLSLELESSRDSMRTKICSYNSVSRDPSTRNDLSIDSDRFDRVGERKSKWMEVDFVLFFFLSSLCLIICYGFCGFSKSKFYRFAWCVYD